MGRNAEAEWHTQIRDGLFGGVVWPLRIMASLNRRVEQ